MDLYHSRIDYLEMIRMDHIELYVSNLQKTKLFYSKFLVQLGFELFQEWEEGFSYKKESFYIVFVQVKEKYQSTNYHRCYVGLNHLAFSCSDKTIITKIREQLIEENVELLYDDKFPFAGGKNHYALYFEDPDRIKVEIVYRM